MKTNLLCLSVVFVAGAVGACVTTNVPAALELARMSDLAARSGPPAELASRELAAAEQVLGTANQECLKNGNTDICRDLAYIAQNKLELACVVAQTEMDLAAAAESRRTDGTMPGAPVTALRGSSSVLALQLVEERRPAEAEELRRARFVSGRAAQGMVHQ